ncbi:hypothetical protein SPRG_13840 [Saprolegnia parasitica CBS 223.65]|uniref:Arrestin C-terminal-like domain-containing protein n=1 Tax=Saprolegnia parasitica (strain CBS 223.65) TaxID=695850 RepID=A0A067BRA5_SAPPC|nr:hypothetical protein SPRG_13840 [Saprolegnia parasitica CBS 223.65]KDO21049.1 hypothetical protein SPRG_13840 [Saprolegnia parasitica CBS 223.65]|eukprot:XP_012208229.1 hypothetical protein SPRG_13840 [Saprolegnia parasitica CBS 223.65]
MALAIELSKDYYTTGDALSGRIHVTSIPDDAAFELVLTLRGKEKVVVASHPTGAKATPPTTHRHVFFEDTLLHTPITTAPASFGFEFEWPEELPGSYENVRHAALRAKIQYKLCARLMRRGATMASVTRPVLVYGSTAYVAKPFSDNQSQKILFLKCLSQGRCSVEMTLDKNVYAIGDSIQITADIQNTSRRRVKCIQYVCTQDVHVQCGPSTRLFSCDVGQDTRSGLAPYKSVLRTDTCDALRNQMYPSTKGSLLRVEYALHIIVEIPACPNVELTLPLIVGPPKASSIFAPPPTPLHRGKGFRTEDAA